MSSHLSITGLSKRFLGRDQDVQALVDISVEVKPGEMLMLVGPSGCGKSTILNIVAGLEKADSGEVLVDGKPIGGPGPDRAVVFQDGALFPWLNVRKNIEFGLKQQGVPTREREQRAREMLETLRLTQFENRNIHELSGGMRQRVAIGRALILSPKILLMDEPFSALDALTREDLYALIQELRMENRTTIIFVTHNVREAVTLGDRVAIMSPRPGRIRSTFEIVIPPPRKIDDPDVSRQAREISEELRREPF